MELRRLKERLVKIASIFSIAQLVTVFQFPTFSLAIQASQNIYKEIAISVLIISVSSLPSSVKANPNSTQSEVSSSASLHHLNSSQFPPVVLNEGRSSQFANVNVSLSLNDFDEKSHNGTRTRTSRRIRLSKINPSFTLNKESRNRKKTRRRKSRPHLVDETVEVDTKPAQNFNEDIADLLRKNILSQLGDMDPLLCLPKALCGLSSRQSHMEKDVNSNPIGLGLDPTDGDVLSNYFQIMKTVVQQGGGGGSLSEKAKRKSKSTKTGFGSDYYYANDDEDYYEDDSASLPSNEDSSEEVEEDDDNDSQSKEVTFFSDLDEEDQEYYREKKKMQKLMENEEVNLDKNWWEVLPSTDPYRNVYPDEKDPGEDSKWPQFTFVPDSFSSFIGSMMPSMAWGFGGKSPDAFSDDPFFENFRSLGRSLNSGVRNPKSFLESLLGKKFTSSLSNLPKESTYTTSTVRKGKMIPRRRIKKTSSPTTYRINSKRKRLPSTTSRPTKKGSDKIEVINMDDPVERFQMAIEIGKKFKSPQQCEHVFNGCPFSYEEIVSIINLTRKNAEDANTETTTEPSHSENSDESKAVVTHKTPSGETYEIELKVGNSASDVNATKTRNKPLRKKSKPKMPNTSSILPTSYAVYEPEAVTIYRTALPSDADSSKPTLHPEVPETPEIAPQVNQAKPSSPLKSSRVQKQKKPLRPLKKNKGKKSIRHKQWGRQPTRSSEEYNFQEPHSKHVGHNNDHPYPYEPTSYHSSSPTVTNYHYYHSNGPSLATTNYHPYPFEIVTQSPSPKNSIASTSSSPMEIYTSRASDSTSYSTEPSTLLTSTSTPAPKKQKSVRKGKNNHKKKDNKSSEERIVIRLTDAPSTSASHLNNFFNIIPIPFRSLFSATAPTEQYSPQSSSDSSFQSYQQQHSPLPFTQFYKPLLPSAVANYFPSFHQQYQTAPTYYPTQYQHNHQQYYSSSPVASPSPASSSMFPSVVSYVFGKKKKK